MATYECVYIARQELTAAQTEQLSTDLTKIVSSNNGEIKNQEYWGLRNLAYKIRKNRKGHYVFMNVDAPATALSELERSLHFNEDVLRFMSIRVEELEEDASPMMRNKSSRDDRSIRRDDDDSKDGED